MMSNNYIQGNKTTIIHSLLYCVTVLIIILIMPIAATTARAQTGVVQGVALDSDTKEPLIWANVFVSGEDPVGTTTDLYGRFSLEVPAGKIQLSVSYTGYYTRDYGLEIAAGDTLNLDTVYLTPSVSAINGCVFLGYSIANQRHLHTEDLQELPAVYDDPGRALALTAGVLNTNDQTNLISVRGNNPNGLKWYLEGVEIPNPNHTPNAGTAGDRVTSGGGGVNMIKPQFLAYTTFYNGGFTANYGNAIGGVVGMQLDEPREDLRLTSTIGIIGLDAQLKGRLNDRWAINANARYSTVGLLTGLLGLDFGGESINYYDINGSLSYKSNKAGRFKLFTVAGVSNNIFEAPRDTALREVNKDRFDIDFNSVMGLIGISHELWVKEGYLRTTIAQSGWNSTRSGYLLDENNDFSRTLLQRDSLRHRRFSYRSLYQRGEISAELRATHLSYELNNFDSLAQFEATGKLSGWLLQPNISRRIEFGRFRRHSIEAGFHTMYFTHNNTWSAEPRINYAYKGRAGVLRFSYGFNSQLQSPEVYLSTDGNSNLINQDLDFTHAHHLNLGWTGKIFSTNSVAVNTYFQYLEDIPILDNANSSFSVVNDLNSFITQPLTNTGEGYNYGIEASWQRYFDNDLSITLNGAYYQSKYKGGDGVWRDTRYNGSYGLNAIMAKNWTGKDYYSKKGNSIKKKYGVYLRGVYAGGLRESPIDEAASQLTGRTIFIDSEAFTLQNRPIFKIDLRLLWQKRVTSPDGSIHTSTLSLDIQNLTNQQNEAFQYYDVLQGQVVTKYQLGLIPLLAWRRTF